PGHFDADRAIAAVRKRIGRIVTYDVHVSQFIGYLMGQSRHVVYGFGIIDWSTSGFGDVGHEVSSIAAISGRRIGPAIRLRSISPVFILQFKHIEQLTHIEAEERPIAPTGQGPGDWPARARVRHRNARPGAATATARPAAISALLRKSQTIYEDTGFRDDVDRFIVADFAAGCIYPVGHEEHGLTPFYTSKMPGDGVIDCLVDAGTVPSV